MNQRIDFKKRAEGCLLGGAIGDAFGYPIEFMSLDEIRSQNGGDILRRPIDRRGIYQFSDDTQMTVLTALGLLEADPIDGNIWKLYRRWAEFQDGKGILSDSDHWVFSYRSMREDRAPGLTCLRSIRENDAAGTIEHPYNDSKGCGGVMRISPVPIWSIHEGGSSLESTMAAARIAAYTHGNPLGYVTAGFLSSMLFRIFGGAGLRESIRNAKDDCGQCFKDADLSEMMDIIDLAVGLADSGASDQEAMAEIGEGWVAEETLAMALFSCLRHPDSIRDAIVCAVNVTGDSDSIGAVTGNIMGALLGSDVLEQEFDVGKLEDGAMILRVSEMLCNDDQRDPDKTHRRTHQLLADTEMAMYDVSRIGSRQNHLPVPAAEEDQKSDRRRGCDRVQGDEISGSRGRGRQDRHTDRWEAGPGIRRCLG